MADTPPMSTIPESFAALRSSFRAEHAAGINKIIQFVFTGAEPGTWLLHVHDGQVDYAERPAENPNATVTVASEDWLKILRNELNAVSAFMGGKLKVQGDLSLMMAFQNWFARA